MNQKTKKQLTHWLSVIVIGIALGLALQFVRAWTEPTVAPPGGNIGAPINTGPNLQSKSGSLNVFGVGSDHGIWATGSSYAVGGQSAINASVWGTLGNGNWGGYFSGPVGSNAIMQAPTFSATDYMQSPIFDATVYMQAPIFYDTGATYYVDPNGVSRLNYTVTDNILNYGTISTPQICLNGVCRDNWPSTSSTDTLQTVTNRGNSTTQPITSAGDVKGGRLCIGEDCRTSWPVDTNTWPAASSCQCSVQISCDGGQSIDFRTYMYCGSGWREVFSWRMNVGPGYGATSCSGGYDTPCISFY